LFYDDFGLVMVLKVKLELLLGVHQLAGMGLLNYLGTSPILLVARQGFVFVDKLPHSSLSLIIFINDFWLNLTL